MQDSDSIKPVPLSELVLFLGRGQGPSYVDFDSPVKAVNQKCVRGGKVAPEHGRAHNPKVSVKEACVLRPGDVCVNSTGTGTIGRVALWANGASGTFFADSHVTIVRPDPDKVNSLLLTEILSLPEVQRDLETFCFTGSTNQIELSRSAFLELKLKLHKDRKVQDFIARGAETLNNLISHTESLISKYQSIKQGLMHDLFTRGIDENGKLRPRYEDAPQLYKKTELGWVPKEWEVKRLSAIADRITSGARNWSQYFAEEGALFLRIGNLTREHAHFRLNDLIRVNTEKNRESERTRLTDGDILISITADLGIIGHYRASLGEAYVNQHIAMVRLAGNENCSSWVANILMSPVCQVQIRRYDDPGAKAGLNLPTVGSLRVPLPLRHEQKRSVLRIEAIEQLLDDEKMRLSKMRWIKSGLMHDLLTGKVPVKLKANHKKAA